MPEVSTDNLKYPAMLVSYTGIELLDISFEKKEITHYGFISDVDFHLILKEFSGRYESAIGRASSTPISIKDVHVCSPKMFAVGTVAEGLKCVIFEQAPQILNIKYSNQNVSDTFKCPVPYIYQIFFFKEIDGNIVVNGTYYLFAYEKAKDLTTKITSGFHLPNVEYSTKKVCWGKTEGNRDKSTLEVMANNFLRLYLETEFNEDYWTYSCINDDTMDKLHMIDPGYSFYSLMKLLRATHGEEITHEQIRSYYRDTRISLRDIINGYKHK